MKNIWICFFLLLSLAACTSGSPNQRGCNEDGELCISLRTEEPIRFGSQIIVTITITSKKDISDLGVTLYHDADVTVEGPQTWDDNVRSSNIFLGGASWLVSVKNNQSLTFIRKLSLPPREGDFWVKAEASTPNLRIADSITIIMTSQGGTIYMSGTAIPITMSPLPTMNPSMLETLRARPTETPYPILTPYSTSTSTPIATSPVYPPPASPTSVWDAPGYPPYP
jgi:hypothetical protein